MLFVNSYAFTFVVVGNIVCHTLDVQTIEFVRKTLVECLLLLIVVVEEPDDSSERLALRERRFLDDDEKGVPYQCFDHISDDLVDHRFLSRLLQIIRIVDDPVRRTMQFTEPNLEQCNFEGDSRTRRGALSPLGVVGSIGQFH